MEQHSEFYITDKDGKVVNGLEALDEAISKQKEKEDGKSRRKHGKTESDPSSVRELESTDIGQGKAVGGPEGTI